jgi:hypothetical protein
MPGISAVSPPISAQPDRRQPFGDALMMRVALSTPACRWRNNPEKQRLCPLADQIVHAHRDQIDADRVHMAGINGDAQLGAHAVGGRHQNRVAIPAAFRSNSAPKPAQARHDARPRRGAWRQA